MTEYGDHGESEGEVWSHPQHSIEGEREGKGEGKVANTDVDIVGEAECIAWVFQAEFCQQHAQTGRLHLLSQYIIQRGEKWEK